MNYNAAFLVVDDMEGMRSIVTSILRQIGIKNITTAANGADAWRMLQTQTVDVVISDWNMPVMSGLDLLRKIRTTPRLANLPMLMMTSEAERFQVQIAIEAGVSEYMIKPFNVSALETKLKKVFDQSQSSTQSHHLERPVPAVIPSRVPRKITPEPNSNAAASKANILVVDDIPDNLDILVELLSDDYQVKAANSGERALKILNAGKIPDLILLDIMMPDMNGFEVCRRIKADPKTAEVPIIFLSTTAESIDITKGLEIGAVDFITKPADPPILRARIATHLKLRRSFDEIKQSRLALIEQNAVLEENLRLREEVERISQHDLKNPVAGIISFASILRDDRRLAQDHKDIIGYIEQSAYSVLNMVNLSLDLYKMEQGSYEFQANEVDLVALLQRIVNEKTSELASREININFIHDAATPVSGDELLCYSMFGNLLKNAMEAASANTVIQITLHPEPQAKRLCIEISNNGVVPLEIRAHFFEKFATAGKPNGTGLGAFSARLIAQTQGGDIHMQTSDETNTTTISVRLPAHENPARGAH